MSESRDYDQLLYVWKEWRDVTGPKMRKIFAESVEIMNNDARENGYKGNETFTVKKNWKKCFVKLNLFTFNDSSAWLSKLSWFSI